MPVVKPFLRRDFASLVVRSKPIAKEQKKYVCIGSFYFIFNSWELSIPAGIWFDYSTLFLIFITAPFTVFFFFGYPFSTFSLIRSKTNEDFYC